MVVDDTRYGDGRITITISVFLDEISIALSLVWPKPEHEWVGFLLTRYYNLRSPILRSPTLRSPTLNLDGRPINDRPTTYDLLSTTH